MQRVVGAVPAFEFSVARLGIVPNGVLYLAPEPAVPFVELIGRLRREFPEVAPYWDHYDKIVPHTTVADPALADGANPREEIGLTVSTHLPIPHVASETLLLERVRPSPTPWDERGRFPLAATQEHPR